MAESALRLRRRCLFLLDGGVMTAALMRRDAATAAEALLLRESALTPETRAVAAHWAAGRATADWQECVESLLFEAEANGEGGAESRRALLRLVDIFAAESRAYDDAAATFAADYWRRALRSQQQPQQQQHSNGSHTHWSIAADLPPAVAQLFGV